MSERFSASEEKDEAGPVKAGSGASVAVHLTGLKDLTSNRVAGLFKDKLYTWEAWTRHLSWTRYLPHVGLLQAILVLSPPLLWFTLVAVLCGVYQDNRESGMPNLQDTKLTFTYSLVTFALGLLMVFKTNSSYARWYEARVAWSQACLHVRNLTRKAAVYRNGMPQPLRKMLVRWIVALPYVLRSHLMAYAPGTLELDELLTAEEREWLAAAPHKPLAAAQAVIASFSRVAELHPMVLMDIDKEVAAYVDNVVTCERLSSTPIPVPYSKHTVNFLMLYLTFLPFALWPMLHYYTVMVTFIVSFFLLAIEHVGVQLENPFFVIPLAPLSAIAHADALAISSKWLSGSGQDAYALVVEWRQKEGPAWQEGAVALDDQAATIEAGLDLRCEGSLPDPSLATPFIGAFGASPYHAAPTGGKRKG